MFVDTRTFGADSKHCHYGEEERARVSFVGSLVLRDAVCALEYCRGWGWGWVNE